MEGVFNDRPGPNIANDAPALDDLPPAVAELLLGTRAVVRATDGCL